MNHQCHASESASTTWPAAEALCRAYVAQWIAKPLGHASFAPRQAHAVVGFGFAFFRIPQMMRHELEQDGFWRRPGQRRAGRGKRPGLQISEVAGKRPQGVFSHAFVNQMPKRLDVLVSQEHGKLVAPFQRQHGGDRVELFRAEIDSAPCGRPCSS